MIHSLDITLKVSDTCSVTGLYYIPQGCLRDEMVNIHLPSTDDQVL